MNPGARIRQLQKREAMLGKRPEGPPRQGPKKGPKKKHPKARRYVGGRIIAIQTPGHYRAYVPPEEDA